METLRKSLWLGSGALMIGVSIGQAQAAPSDYATIKNLEKGESQCLAIDADGMTVSFAACDDSEAQQWSLQRTSEAYYFIRNEAAAARGQDRCLRVEGTAVKLGTCSGDGYTSMRLWAPSEDFKGTLALSNKYRGDLGKTETFRAVGDRVAMAAASDEPAAKWQYGRDLPSPTRPVVATKSVLVLATHYNGRTPADPEKVRKAVFGDGNDNASLRHYLETSSRDELTLTGTILKDVNLGDEPGTCNHNAILEAARKAARERGEEPGSFDYLFVDLSSSKHCNWVGLAASPGNWILANGSGYKYWMWTHEFGHSLGAQHPGTWRDCPVENGTVVLGGQCRSGGAPDDPSDTMGGGGGRQYPVDYQLYAGWLTDADVPIIRKDGVFHLAPLWQDSGGAQGYRIRRSDGSFLLLEYRQPRPGFEGWPEDSPFVNGVIVRTMRIDGARITNHLVDTTPGSAAGMKDAPLMPGKSLYDELSGKLITVKHADSHGVDLDVRSADGPEPSAPPVKTVRSS